MSENREEILANFQSIAAIDDLGIAIHHLEEANWDLLTAIHRVIPQDGPNLLSRESMAYESDFASYNNLNSFDIPPPFNEEDIDLTSTAEQMQPPAQPMDLIETSSSSTSKVPNNGFFPGQNSFEDKNLQFSIHYNSQVYDITMNNRSTVDDLKTKINDVSGIPNCRQALKGWPASKQREAQLNSTVLRSLNLLPKTSLHLTDLTEEGFLLGEGDFLTPSTSKASSSGTSATINPSNVNYTLHINLQPVGEIHKLKFPEKQTVLSVKTDVYAVTNIPVRHQVWSGWPNNVSDTKTLGELGIEFEHNLVLRQANDTNKPINTATSSSMPLLDNDLVASTTSTTAVMSAPSGTERNRTNSSVIEIDSDSSIEEFEDASEDFNADDDIFSESPAQPRIKHLIPDNCDDETIGCLQFIENFTERYGQHNRIFFEGCLEDALKEACHKPARERKLLAIYLHHDGSVLSNVFCGQLLSCESIIQVLLEHFVVYGWDLTYESNKNMFLSSISACVNHTAQMTVRNIPVDKLPAILIVSRNRSICEVFSVIYGNVGVDDLLSQLLEFTELYSEQLKTDIREENERNARESIKFEQDTAYKESLEADRAKEEARKQKELMIATERQRLESEKAESEAKRSAIMAQAASTLPEEPVPNAEGITKIRVRTSKGILERRFTIDTKLQIMLNFITSEGYLQDEHKVLTSFPRRDLTTMDPEDTLQNLKLFPQETVILEER